MMDNYKNNYCIIIPIYNHPHKLEALIRALRGYGFPIILIDDGSNQECKKTIKLVLEKSKHVSVHELPYNQGKGAAVMAGFKQAFKQKFSHAIQIDADFQHDVKDIGSFVQCSEKDSKALICGIPKYDATVPKGRLYSRYLTHVWVWINTLSNDIKDSMCGYRVYPLKETMRLINDAKISKRMNFDIEIIVRLKWRNINIINLPTRVIYHEDVPSNFRLFKDNIGISLTHAKLFFGMIIRLPQFLMRKINDE